MANWFAMTPSSGLPATFSPCQGEKGLWESLLQHGDKSFTALPEGMTAIS